MDDRSVSDFGLGRRVDREPPRHRKTSQRAFGLDSRDSYDFKERIGRRENVHDIHASVILKCFVSSRSCLVGIGGSKGGTASILLDQHFAVRQDLFQTNAPRPSQWTLMHEPAGGNGISGGSPESQKAPH